MEGMTNRVHTFAPPDLEEKLTWFYTEILGGSVIKASGMPVVAFRFPNGSSLSVELTEDALDEGQMRHAPWMEVQSDDPEALKARVIAARLPMVDYPLTGRFYFQAPGGQVWGIAG